jgi:hypothetical protein
MVWLCGIQICSIQGWRSARPHDRPLAEPHRRPSFVTARRRRPRCTVLSQHPRPSFRARRDGTFQVLRRWQRHE